MTEKELLYNGVISLKGTYQWLKDNKMVKQTNEEWFCSLPTEQKATFLAIQIRLGVEFYRTNDERYQNHDWWVEWLKQPHKE